MFYYLPWSPQSLFGHVVRVAVYFLTAGLLSVAVADPFEKARWRAATSVRDMLRASSDASYNLLAAELTRKDDTVRLIQDIKRQGTGGDPRTFVDKWLDKVLALGPEGLIELMRHTDPRLRELAANGLGRINQSGPLSQLLEDKEIRVRRAAAMALASAGWTPEDPGEKSRFEMALAIPATPAEHAGTTQQLLLVGLHPCPKCGSSQTIPLKSGKVGRLAKQMVLGIGVGMVTGSPTVGAAVGTGLANADAAAFHRFRCQACGNEWKIIKPA
jgi:hypothetical protein